MVDGINSTQNSNAQYATESKSDLDKDAFLQLMIAQLQNQDPLEPLDGTDYSAQLAQFSSLEQMKNINDSINVAIDANYLLTQSINNTMTATLIGKDVKIASDTIVYDNQESTDIGYQLPADAKNVEVTIKDESGKIVKTFENLERGEGEYKLSWDFTDNDGNSVKSGNYTYEVKAETMNGEDMAVTQYLIGRIDGVRFSSEGTALVVNGIEYSISDVFEILEGDYLANGIGNNEESTNESFVDDPEEDIVLPNIGRLRNDTGH